MYQIITYSIHRKGWVSTVTSCNIKPMRIGNIIREIRYHRIWFIVNSGIPAGRIIPALRLEKAGRYNITYIIGKTHHSGVNDFDLC